jgi:hypothetical protein
MKEFNDDIKLPRIELEVEHVDGGKFNVEELLNMKEFTDAYPGDALLCSRCCCPQGVNPVMMFEGEEEDGVQQPRADLKYGGDFNFDELLNIDVQEQMPV